MTDNEAMSLPDKLYRTRYEPDAAHPHVRVDAEKYRRAGTKKLLKICPAEVYKPAPNDPDAVQTSHENCLECGTCRQAAPEEGVEWTMPDGGKGVKYRYG